MASIAEALNVALDHHLAGRLAEAEIIYDRIIAADAEQAAAWGLSGVLLAQTGRGALGATRLAEAMRLAPHVPDHHDNMAAVMAGAADWRAVLRLSPSDPDALFELAKQAQDGGDPTAARPLLTRAARLRPDNAETWYRLACAEEDCGRKAAAETAMRRALALAPGSAFVLFLRAGWDDRAYRPHAAVVGYRRALRVAPDRAEARIALGAALLNAGDVDAAEQNLRAALERQPDLWQAHSSLLFALCFKAEADPAAVYAEFRRFDAKFARPLTPAAPVHRNDRDPERRLRVGYVSPNFYGHPCGHFLLPVVENHDPAQIAVHCYASSAVSDAWTDIFRGRSEQFRQCENLNDDALTALIQSDEIDVLVDCSGHMAGHRLFVFARKPAPVQVSYPLFPNTTGMDAMDYRIMDRHFAPPWADAVHAEKLVRMPDAHVVYREKPGIGAPPDEPPMRRAGFVRFGCFNTLAKLNPRTVAAWSAILRRVPNSRLLIKWRGLDEAPSAQKIKDRFAAHGAAPQRIETIGWSADPYAPYFDVDLALDPFVANGGTTTCDALWAGAPVISCVEDGHFGRVGLCHLTNIGMPELLAENEAAYVDLAVRLANDPATLTRIRRDLRRRMAASPLMDGARYVRALENAYRVMWRRWCAGAPPAAFDAGFDAAFEAANG